MTEETAEDERPPVFTRWRGWYILVLSVLVAQIVVYSLITYAFK